MNDFKEFTGKSVDEAIEEACAFFKVEREKLEIEILSGGSTGIFGLVGVKKAKIQARERNNLAELNLIVRETLERLLRPLAEDADITVEADGDRVVATVIDKDNSGLIIGREGQTLAALQYIAGRIIARRWPNPIRLQIDTGEYREKQDENLRQIALHLADKAKSSGKPQSTKPLSSYHRRVVHMALQEDQTIVTRSKGEGPLKRVLIMPKREGAPAREARPPRAARGRD